MTSKRNKAVLLSMLISFLLAGCSPKHDDYTEKWIGMWQTTDETEFPQSKYLHTGAIIKNNDARNMIIISGTLFGVNSSYQIPAKLTSEQRATLTYSNEFDIQGNAYFNGKDTIRFYLTITQDNRTVRDTVIAAKSK